MSTKTTNLELIKPDAMDYYDVSVQNQNLDIIDEVLGRVDTGVVTEHVANKSNPHGVTKSQVGLGNVDNTSDENKPVSTAQQTAINTVQTNINTHTSNKSNPHGVTASQVGLGNVPNVTTNNQTPTYTVASSNTALSSGEVLSTAFGKIAKAVSSLISHLADTTVHITSAERTKWNAKLDATATATNAEKVDGYHVTVVTTLPSSPDASTIYFVKG